MIEVYDYNKDRIDDGYNLYEKMYILNETFHNAVDTCYVDDPGQLALRREEREEREREARENEMRAIEEYNEWRNPYA